jgi:hypothetical protein
MKNMKKEISIHFFGWLFALSVSAQTTPVNWEGEISIGGNTTKVYCSINLQSTCKLYLHTDTLRLTGNFAGESGARVYFSVNAQDTHGFMNISGTASGDTEIIPDVFDVWDGSRIDCVKASYTGSATAAFQITDDTVLLKHERQNNHLLWYIEKPTLNPCLPLIVQLGNHTLLVNNNNATNGGYKFVSYAWYKNGQLLQEGSHADNSGSYYTGGADLDENAEYTVVATDSAGNHYSACPYRFVLKELPINVTVYPNPVPRNANAYIHAETQDLSPLQNASVEIYDILGQSVGKANINGQPLTSVDLPAKAGIYILKFKTKDYVKNIKITVE